MYQLRSAAKYLHGVKYNSMVSHVQRPQPIDVTLCLCVLTPCWIKSSLGKFMEMSFYNRSARGCTGGCTHPVRDCHSLFFTCEGYEAKFDFVPMHPFALHIRRYASQPASQPFIYLASQPAIHLPSQVASHSPT